MSRNSYQTLINLGRKAGLNTRDLYRAMSNQPPDPHISAPGQTDCNGFSGELSQQGKVEYRPTHSRG